MAIGLGIAALVVSAGGAYMQHEAGKEGADRQSQLDAQNRARMRMEGAETVRRTMSDQRKEMGSATAAAAGSGFGIGDKGSAKWRVLNQIKGEHVGELNWLMKANNSGIDIASKEASMRYDINRMNTNAGLISGIGSAIGAGASMYNASSKWWS